MELTTNPRDFSTNTFPFFSKPKLIGYFSVGPRRNYVNDFSNLRYLNKIPTSKVRFNLNHNSENALKRKESEERLKFLLNYFQDHRELFNVYDKRVVSLNDVPFMCYRGFLREVSALPYEFRETFRFAACLFNGIIYLHSLKTPEAIIKKANTTDREKVMCAWGYKFEQYMVSDDPNSDPDIEPPVDESSEFSCVFETRLNQHRLIYGAEMDGLLVPESQVKEGLRPDVHSPEQVLEKLRNSKFIELKTSRRIEERKHDIAFRKYKTLKWWLQSFFADIETIICGIRDDDGIVEEIKQFKMSDLPKQNNNYWHPNVCMNFCNEILHYIKEAFYREIIKLNRGATPDSVRDLPMMELVFERLPNSPVRLSTPLPDENISVLTDAYIHSFPKV